MTCTFLLYRSGTQVPKRDLLRFLTTTLIFRVKLTPWPSQRKPLKVQHSTRTTLKYRDIHESLGQYVLRSLGT